MEFKVETYCDNLFFITYLFIGKMYDLKIATTIAIPKINIIRSIYKNIHMHYPSELKKNQSLSLEIFSKFSKIFSESVDMNMAHFNIGTGASLGLT